MQHGHTLETLLMCPTNAWYLLTYMLCVLVCMAHGWA